MCAHTYTAACDCGGQGSILVTFCHYSTLLLRQDLSVNGELSSLYKGLHSRLQRLPFLPHRTPTLELQICTALLFLSGYWGSKLKSSRLHCEHLNHCEYHPSLLHPYLTVRDSRFYCPCWIKPSWPLQIFLIIELPSFQILFLF